MKPQDWSRKPSIYKFQFVELNNTYIAAWFSFENQAAFLFPEAMKNTIAVPNKNRSAAGYSCRTDEGAVHPRRRCSGHPRLRQHGTRKGISWKRYVQERCFCRTEADMGRWPRCAFLRSGVNWIKMKSSVVPMRQRSFWYAVQGGTLLLRYGDLGCVRCYDNLRCSHFL